MTSLFDGRAPPVLAGKRPLPPDFSPADLEGAWYGTADELVAAPYRAALKAAATINLLAAPLAAGFDQDAQDRWFAEMVDPPLRTLEQLNERAAIHGTAARVVGELGAIAVAAPTGPVGVGTIAAGSRFGLEARAGKEHPLALGAVEGATLAAGFALPLSLPLRRGWGPALLQRLNYGVGSNVALGLAQRGAEQALGEDVEMFNGWALALDAALGAFFGGAAHIHGRLTGEAADAAMTAIEHASASRVVPDGQPPQAALDHLAARQMAAHSGESVIDPPVPASMAAVIDADARGAEAVFRASEQKLAALEAAASDRPLPLPQVERPRAPAAVSGARPAPAWEPVNFDGETVDIDLPAVRQMAAQMDQLGARIDGRKASDVLDDATKEPGAVDDLLDAVTTCAMNYGH